LEERWNERIRKSRNVTGQNQSPSAGIFKIMAEFVDGFEALAKLVPVAAYLAQPG
jgi:hypothetical protein